MILLVLAAQSVDILKMLMVIFIDVSGQAFYPLKNAELEKFIAHI